MKVAGRRKDGALNLSIGGGLAVIIRSGKKSPPIDVSLAAKMGPWVQGDNSLATRRALDESLRRARVVPLRMFSLALSLDEQRDRVMTSLRERFGSSGGSGLDMASSDVCIPANGLGQDWVVYGQQGKNFGLAYAIADDGVVTFEGDPVEVKATWESLTDEDVVGDEPKAEGADETVSLRRSAWFKKFMASKKMLSNPTG